jgi:hypothetical protein
MFVPHRKHITYPLRAQQVNAIYRFATMVYCYNYQNFGYYPSPCPLYIKEITMDNAQNYDSYKNIILYFWNEEIKHHTPEIQASTRSTETY